MLRSARIAVVLFACFAGESATARVTANEIDAFLAAKPAAWGTSPNDEVLKLLVKTLPRSGYDGAVRALAVRWHVSEPAAAFIAEAVLRDTIDPFADVPAVTSLYLQAIDADPTSRM